MNRSMLLHFLLLIHTVNSFLLPFAQRICKNTLRYDGNFSCSTVLKQGNHNDDNDNQQQKRKGFDLFQQYMEHEGLSTSTQKSILSKLIESGFTNSQELMVFSKDLSPETVAKILQSDFHFTPLLSHQARGVITTMLKDIESENKSNEKIQKGPRKTHSSPVVENRHDNDVAVNDIASYENASGKDITGGTSRSTIDVDSLAETEKRPLYKEVIVNKRAQTRRSSSSTGAPTNNDQHEYGLPTNYHNMYPQLATELDEFYNFMTQPTTISQENPIRAATANVYMRHAKLFLGWYVSTAGADDINEKKDMSIFTIIKNREKDSAKSILDFIMWLRSSRNISVSYEANLLRGLTKLLKFRFARESQVDPSYGDKTFADIPMIRELRKLHRDANKRQAGSSRSSDEELKWLPWKDYLQVINSIESDLTKLINYYDDTFGALSEDSHNAMSKAKKLQQSTARRKIATIYQRYLILSIFASLPDRQRTIRELEIGKSFIKDQKSALWTVKHGANDYKTGKTYGERPPIALSPTLVPRIDDFLERWRESLLPSTNKLFVQPRTGKPLTQDSVYQIVTRTCYEYTGKKTNPHLIRDMIVTHVRETKASEKELEALALLMGHSIHMQRTSYDRRTLTKKVAPAVELLESVNKLCGEE